MLCDSAAGAPDDTVTDAVLDGRVVLRQLRRGHRAGTDAVLLAAAAAAGPCDRMIDVGAGVGTVGLILAHWAADLTGVLLEADAQVAGLAAENCRLNGVEGRLTVARCDLFDRRARRDAGVGNGSATLVVTNPPFFATTAVRRSPDRLRADAHVLGHQSHGAWLVAALSLLEPKGRFRAIQRPEVLPAWLAASEGRLGGIAIVPVHAHADTPAIRMLFGGVKGSRAPLRFGAPLVLHGPDGRRTARAEALHRGSARIEL